MAGSLVGFGLELDHVVFHLVGLDLMLLLEGFDLVLERSYGPMQLFALLGQFFIAELRLLIFGLEVVYFLMLEGKVEFELMNFLHLAAIVNLFELVDFFDELLLFTFLGPEAVVDFIESLLNQILFFQQAIELQFENLIFLFPLLIIVALPLKLRLLQFVLLLARFLLSYLIEEALLVHLQFHQLCSVALNLLVQIID